MLKRRTLIILMARVLKMISVVMLITTTTISLCMTVEMRVETAVFVHPEIVVSMRKTQLLTQKSIDVRKSPKLSLETNILTAKKSLKVIM